jgi:hypothetical protein
MITVIQSPWTCKTCEHWKPFGHANLPLPRNIAWQGWCDIFDDVRFPHEGTKCTQHREMNEEIRKQE